VALIGAGNLGRALAAYQGFFRKGFMLVAVFDADPAKVGQVLPGSPGLCVLPMRDLPALVEREGVRMGMLAVPASCAQHVAGLMIKSGIKGILNFAPVMLDVPSDVMVASVDLAVQLEQLSFRVHGLFAQHAVIQAK
jgi:redox-sensing transcriptional repressor